MGALALMLPVFAQFAAVMFFLAGLGLLNLLWLPVLDISFRVQELGAVIRAPYQFWRWLFGLVGANGYWPAVYLCIGGGLLIFFLGTLAWLRSRARKEEVAIGWVYRLSRHPQYLGWILWSYGAFLLLLQARYPKRSWGIAADLSWLLATSAPRQRARRCGRRRATPIGRCGSMRPRRCGGWGGRTQCTHAEPAPAVGHRPPRGSTPDPRLT